MILYKLLILLPFSNSYCGYRYTRNNTCFIRMHLAVDKRNPNSYCITSVQFYFSLKTICRYWQWLGFLQSLGDFIQEPFQLPSFPSLVRVFLTWEVWLHSKIRMARKVRTLSSFISHYREKFLFCEISQKRETWKPLGARNAGKLVSLQD